ncbi:CAP domain-containing protein [Pricia sp. S334]|uniref:CAP domain-containing protein n=1 Tax=Pricia mediterranea TaxID=3076079 RepID=A0ABU3L7I0_9FLAO|nr:CAP domain-containing protein [Pricia sp. S334]MDT7829017.1 CAP domain-containing protein [Pricia sp. S334]
MKMRIHLMVLAVFTCALVSCSKESGETLNSVERQNVREVEKELLSLVNDHRVSLGKNALQFNATAYDQANVHTDYMIGKGAINHDNFTIRASAISKEVDAQFVAENVAKDYSTASGAFVGWLSSANHKHTMEDDFTHTAISVKKDENGTAYFTQIFYR